MTDAVAGAPRRWKGGRMGDVGIDDVAGELDPRIMQACRILYDRAPTDQIVSLVRTWVRNGDDPVASAYEFVTMASTVPASS